MPDVSVQTVPVSRSDLTAAKPTTSEPSTPGRHRRAERRAEDVRTAALAEPMNSTHTKVSEPADDRRGDAR